MSSGKMMHCEACGKELESPQRCGRCKEACYCSKDCQASHWTTHKDSCTRQNYLIKFQLCPESIAWRLREAITDPPVERTLSCPADSTFDQLHTALQVAFRWPSTHSYDFAILDPTFQSEGGTGRALLDTAKDITQRDRGNIDPDSAREYILRVLPKNPSMDVMDHMDKTHDSNRGHPRTKEKNSAGVKLFQLLDDPQYRDEQLVYTYDFGDRWEHLMTVVGRVPATRRFRCVDGVGHGVAEEHEFDLQMVNAKLSVRTI